LSKNASGDGDKEAVGRAVKERMAQLGLTTAELARRSGLSETTIRGITQATARHNRSTLVAISAVLDWPPDYLVNVLHGEADKNVKAESPLEIQLAKLANGLAGLTEIVHQIDGKIDVIMGPRHSPGEGTKSD
jgi:transcriptional regulator with XRE-family HTH domain